MARVERYNYLIRSRLRRPTTTVHCLNVSVMSFAGTELELIP